MLFFFFKQIGQNNSHLLYSRRVDASPSLARQLRRVRRSRRVGDETLLVFFFFFEEGKERKKKRSE